MLFPEFYHNPHALWSLAVWLSSACFPLFPVRVADCTATSCKCKGRVAVSISGLLIYSPRPGVYGVIMWFPPTAYSDVLLQHVAQKMIIDSVVLTFSGSCFMHQFFLAVCFCHWYWVWPAVLCLEWQKGFSFLPAHPQSITQRAVQLIPRPLQDLGGPASVCVRLYIGGCVWALCVRMATTIFHPEIFLSAWIGNTNPESYLLF